MKVKILLVIVMILTALTSTAQISEQTQRRNDRLVKDIHELKEEMMVTLQSYGKINEEYVYVRVSNILRNFSREEIAWLSKYYKEGVDEEVRAGRKTEDEYCVDMPIHRAMIRTWTYRYNRNMQ
jgi:hypothetical protein